MTKRYDLVATIGSYEKDGETKYLSDNAGTLIVMDDGKMFIKMKPSFNPAGCNRDKEGKVSLAVFEQKPKDSKAGNSYDEAPF